MGTTKVKSAQIILGKGRAMMDKGENMPIVLSPEPVDLKDERAIASKCKIDQKLH